MIEDAIFGMFNGLRAENETRELTISTCYYNSKGNIGYDRGEWLAFDLNNMNGIKLESNRLGYKISGANQMTDCNPERA